MVVDKPPWCEIPFDALSQKKSQTDREMVVPRKWRSIKTSPVGDNINIDWIMMDAFAAVVVFRLNYTSDLLCSIVIPSLPKLMPIKVVSYRAIKYVDVCCLMCMSPR